MDKALIEAYRATDYLVCLNEGEVTLAHSTIAPGIALRPTSLPPTTLAHPSAAWARIRIDQPLPEPLQVLVGTQSWGFITAWNPGSKTRSPADNLAAQRELLTALHAWPDVTIYPAIGTGAGGWNEPSLFVIGPDILTLDTLCNSHGQNAYVHGHGHTAARLRLLRS